MSHLDGLPVQATALRTAALGLTGANGQVRPSTCTTRYAQALADGGVGGAKPNPVFTAMMALDELDELDELGLRPERGDDADAPWSRPAKAP
ncbi:hypothetical protein ACFYNW_06460 [Streptomyces virginiae]|uniref:hypothetical protein n=1 Tax=Streptomyces virginiae TaxID=1961 RepID=UPI0036E64215